MALGSRNPSPPATLIQDLGKRATRPSLWEQPRYEVGSLPLTQSLEGMCVAEISMRLHNTYTSHPEDA